jgi:hypothetical protein
MKKLLIACMLLAGGFAQASAQELSPKDFGYFNHLSGGIVLGTEGIGIEVAAPITYDFAVRMGYSLMPKFKYSKSLNLNENKGAFIKDRVDIGGKLNMGDFKLLVDWYPFRTSSFHATAGFFIGRSTVVKIDNKEPFVKDNYKGVAGIELGVYDPSNPQSESRYTLMTDPNGDIKGELEVNAFKPYLGVGFGRAVPKGRIGVQFDLGIQFWGKPELKANMNYVDRETGENVTNFEPIKRGRITNPDSDYQDLKDAVKTIQKIRVYPVLNIRINGRIF